LDIAPELTPSCAPMSPAVTASAWENSSAAITRATIRCSPYSVSVTANRSTAADEETGYLDLLLAHPVSRTRFVLQRFAALATGAFALAAGIFLAMLVIRPGAQLTDVSPGQFAAQCFQLTLLTGRCRRPRRSHDGPRSDCLRALQPPRPGLLIQ
jgi:ABC-2 type transport system permease protein